MDHVSPAGRLVAQDVQARGASERSRSDAPRWPVRLAAFLGFLLLGAGWAAGAPWFASYDESAHVIRAAGVALGELRVPPQRAIYGGGGYQRVPAGVVRLVEGCDQGTPPPAGVDCDRLVPGRHTVVLAATPAARYAPPYYLGVGLPLVLAPDMNGVVVARLCSVLLSALLLGAALGVAWRHRRATLLPAAVLLAVPPIELNLMGAINPNGWEVASAVAWWTALAALLVVPAAAGTRGVLVLAGVSGTVLLTTRQLGPLLAGVALLAALACVRRGRLRELVRRRDARLLAGVLVVAAAAGVAWTVWSGLLHTSVPREPRPHVPAGAVWSQIVRVRAVDWARQLVARFPGEVVPPAGVLLAWAALVAVVVVAGVRARPRLAAGVGMTVLVAAGTCVLLEIRLYDTLGPSQQGRYYLPLLVGVPLLAGAAPARPRWLARWLPLATAVVTGAVQVYCLLLMMAYWQHGRRPAGLHFLGGAWHPAVGSVLPAALTLAGALLLAVLGAIRAREPG